MWLTFRAYLATLFKVVSPEVVFISIGAAMVLLAVVLHEVLMAKIGFSFLGVALVISAYDLLLKRLRREMEERGRKSSC